MMIAEIVYEVPAVIILNSCVRAITAWDLITSMIKAWVFGAIISIVRPPPLQLYRKRPYMSYDQLAAHPDDSEIRHAQGCQLLD
jgi:hypothetical protein